MPFQNDLVIGLEDDSLKHFRSCGITINGIRARVFPFPPDIQKLQFDVVIEWDMAFLETEFDVSSHFFGLANDDVERNYGSYRWI